MRKRNRHLLSILALPLFARHARKDAGLVQLCYDLGQSVAAWYQGCVLNLLLMSCLLREETWSSLRKRSSFSCHHLGRYFTVYAIWHVGH